MTRISQAPQLARLAALSVIALAALPLSGCLYAQIPVNVPDGDGPEPPRLRSRPSSPRTSPPATCHRP